MCLGQQQPQAPEVRYVGPSDSDIRRQEQSLATFQRQIEQQQSATASQIQQQIDAANARTAEIQSQYDAELAAAQGDTSAAEAAAPVPVRSKTMYMAPRTSMMAMVRPA